MNPGEGGGALCRVATSRWWWAVILVVALGVMTPELVTGVTYTDSIRYNHVWPAQFGELFRSGQLYPRWLPRSWDGFGSPTFYFYPPLFFWVAATIGVLAPLTTSVSLASAAMLGASGIGMRAWLIDRTGPNVSLIGALAYMVAPYHLYDIYGRGALAEACAYAALPPIMLAIRRIGEGRPAYVALLAAGYALLLLGHLPVALLASVTAIPAYVLYIAARADGGAIRPLGWCLAGGVLGSGLAAAYVLPALTLMPHISASALGGVFYSPEAWFFLRPHAWIGAARMLVIIPLTIGAFLLAIGAAVAKRESDVMFWAAVMAGMFVLIAGLVPWVWRLPALAQVQFPWRMLVIADFVTVTALALGRPSVRGPSMIVGAVVMALGALSVAAVARDRIWTTWHQRAQAIELIARDMPDAPEYLPPGIDFAFDEWHRAAPAGAALPVVPRVRADGLGARVRAVDRPNGAMDVFADTPDPTMIVVRRFYFPHWSLMMDGAAKPVDKRGNLVAWTAARGRHVYRLTPGHAPIERTAWAISLASLLILAGLMLWLKTTSQPLGDRIRGDGRRG
jgi:hypothetical protein